MRTTFTLAPAAFALAVLIILAGMVGQVLEAVTL